MRISAIQSLLILGAVTTITIAALALGWRSDAPAPATGMQDLAAIAIERFPTGNSLEDWVSYADEVAVIRVAGEQAVLPREELLALGEGFVGRSLAVEVVQTLWARDEAVSAPASFTVRTAGWALKGESLVAVVVAGRPRLEVGQQYIAPLVLVDGEWSLMSLSATLPVRDGLVDLAERTNAAPLAGFDGRPIDELTAALERTAPDPLALQFQHLPPDQRVIAVARARERAAAAAD